jgi:hypothetical protein
MAVWHVRVAVRVFESALFVLATLRLHLLGFQVLTNTNHNLATEIAVDEMQVDAEFLTASKPPIAPRG